MIDCGVSLGQLAGGEKRRITATFSASLYQFCTRRCRWINFQWTMEILLVLLRRNLSRKKRTDLTTPTVTCPEADHLLSPPPLPPKDEESGDGDVKKWWTRFPLRPLPSFKSRQAEAPVRKWQMLAAIGGLPDDIAGRGPSPSQTRLPELTCP